MHRVLIPPSALQGERITITDPRALHHLRRVLRVKAGEPLECFDGGGRSVSGRIVQSAAGQVVVEVTGRRGEPAPAGRLTLAQALIKPARFDWIVQKASELGVERLVPLVTARTVARLPSERDERKALRWQRIADAAAQQCGRSTVMRLEPPMALGTFLEKCQVLPKAGKVPGTFICTLAVEGVALREALAAASSAQSLCVLIGPEGDFTAAEVALAKCHGAIPVSLGRLTLRSETAALAVIALLQHAAGQL